MNEHADIRPFFFNRVITVSVVFASTFMSGLREKVLTDRRGFVLSAYNYPPSER